MAREHPYTAVKPAHAQGFRRRRAHGGQDGGSAPKLYLQLLQQRRTVSGPQLLASSKRYRLDYRMGELETETN